MNDDELAELFDDAEGFDEFADITDADIEEAGYIADNDLSELIGGLCDESAE